MKRKLTHLFSIGFFSRRHSLAVLVVSAILSIVAIYLSSKLIFKTDYLELMPESWSSVQNLNRFKNDFGGMGPLIPIIETDNIERAKVFVRDFAHEIEKLDEVEFVEYRNPSDFLKQYKYLLVEKNDLEKIESKIDNYVEDLKRTYVPVSFLEEEENPVKKPDFSEITNKYKAHIQQKEFFISSDNKYIALMIQPKSSSLDLEQSKSLITKVKAIENSLNLSTYNAGLHVGYTGMPKIQIDRREHILKQIKKCSLIGSLLILILLSVYLRNIWAVCATLIALGVGTSWGYGLTYLLLGQVNIITGFAITIIMGLAIDYYIHMINRYLILRRSGQNAFDAFQQVFSSTNKANFIACLTTLGATMVLIISKFKGFSELAIVCSLGLICNFLASNTLLPAMITLLEKINFLKLKKDEA